MQLGGTEAKYLKNKYKNMTLPKGWRAYKLKKKSNWAVYAYIITVIIFGLLVILFTNQTAAKSIDRDMALDSSESRQAWDIKFDDSAVDPCSLPYVHCDGLTASQGATEVLREVSAYTSRVEETDDTPCIGASGINQCEVSPKEYGVDYFVASNSFPLYTKLDIEHLGTAIVVDRMNSRYTSRVDIYMNHDLNRALSFGVQVLKVSEL